MSLILKMFGTYQTNDNVIPFVLQVEEKRREIDSLLSVVEVNDTTAHVTWRHFTEDELRFIDGIQIRYVCLVLRIAHDMAD